MTRDRGARAITTAWVAFLLIAGVALVAIWTGAVGPHLGVRTVASSTKAGPHQEVLEIRNDSRSDVTVTDVGLAVPGLRRVAAQLVRADGSPRRFHDTRLSPKESVDVLLTSRAVPCHSKAFVAGDYTVTVRTSIGLGRTMHVERGDRIVRDGPPYRFSDKATARSEVRHRCGFYR